MKIVITERNSVGLDVDVSCYGKLGEVTEYAVSDETNIAGRIKDADIIINNKAPLNEETLKEAPNVKLICEAATGFDNVDIAYCRKRGIKVANVVNYSTDAVAQHTFALLFYVLEKLRFYDTYVKSGEYGAQKHFSVFSKTFWEIAGKTWGIVGMGHIGKRVAEIAKAFGCRVIFYSVSGNSSCTEYERVDFETLLKESDVLSLHCPLSEKTHYLMNLEAMRKMKTSAILLNVARGAVVNNRDLFMALEEGLIAGAGLDVLEQEPIREDNPLSKFMDSDKLVITPHIAWASVEARNRVVAETYRNIEAFLKGEDRNVVNF